MSHPAGWYNVTLQIDVGWFVNKVYSDRKTYSKHDKKPNDEKRDEFVYEAKQIFLNFSQNAVNNTIAGHNQRENNKPPAHGPKNIAPAITLNVNMINTGDVEKSANNAKGQEI